MALLYVSGYLGALLPAVFAANTFVVTNTNDSGPGSLRQAILDANANPGADSITFSIGSGLRTIAPTSPLPNLTDPVLIDGTTQPGFAGSPLIELSGTSATNTSTAPMLHLTAGNTTVRGLIINHFNGGYGISIYTNGGNRIEGCFVGLDSTGNFSTNSRGNGIAIDSSTNNIIGGTTAAARNVISGTGSFGISIYGFNANGNVIQGNYIGTNAAGNASLGNNSGGINIASANNTIGGTAAGAPNVISGNLNNGIVMHSNWAAGNIIQGNYIGTDPSGTVAIPNTACGISLSSTSNNTIGGETAAARNILSGNTFCGVTVSGDGISGNVIQGNYIGTDAAGTGALPNGFYGVDLRGSSGTLVGGNTSNVRNVISGNGVAGVYTLGTFGPGNRVKGNFIGTDATGEYPLGNGSGVTIYGSNNVIGGVDAGAGNVIAYNNGTGVQVESIIPTIARNMISGNSIFSNAGMGIDLGATGVTPNDAGDADSGNNDLQNFPLITSVTGGGGTTTIQGTLNSTPGTAFTIEFFASRACDASGNGEGAKFIGSTATTTDANGNASFNPVLSLSLGAGQLVTATATDPSGNTSEFSPCFGSAAAGTVHFSAHRYLVFESLGVATVTVNRTGGSAGTITVNYATADDTAKAGTDYAETSGTLTFADGELTKTFNLQVFDDGVFKESRKFNLILSGTSDKELLGSPNRAVLDIQENLSISIRDRTFLEGDSGVKNFSFPVVMSRYSAYPVTLSYTTSPVSATSGEDFQSTSGTLTIYPNQLSGSIVVPVNSDTVYEPSETFLVTISDVTNAIIEDGQAVGTITNDDGPPGTIQFGSQTFTVKEDAGHALITVTRTDGASGSVTVNFSTSNGTAQAGSDYTATSGTMVFNPGDASRVISLPIVSDDLNEGDETINLTLSNPTGGAVLGSQTTTVLTIKDVKPLRLILEELGPDPGQASALDAVLFLRDPFPVINEENHLVAGTDKNTRVIIFVTNLELASGESPSSVVVNLLDGASFISYDIEAEDVRPVPLFNFTQVRFRLPDTLFPGVCTIKVKAQGRESNSGTIRIRN